MRPRFAPGGGDLSRSTQETTALSLQESALEVVRKPGAGRLFRVTWDLGVGIRESDDLDAKRTGFDLVKGEIFEAKTEVKRDGRTFYELVDGRGWVFDWVEYDEERYKIVELAAQLYAVEFPAGVSGIIWESDPSLRFCRVHDFSDGTTAMELNEAGVRIGDVLLMIDGDPVIGMPFSKLLERIWGTSGRQPGGGIFYQVCTKSVYGVGVREEPDFFSARTGKDIRRGEVFEVDDIVPVDGGPTYLKLADGTGWVFDTRPVDPDNPSVKNVDENVNGCTLTMWRGSVKDLEKTMGMQLTESSGGGAPVTITVYEEGQPPQRVSGQSGCNLRQTLAENGFQVYDRMAAVFNCSSQQLCGTCVLQVLKGGGNLTMQSANEKHAMKSNPNSYRLCCGMDVYGDISVRIRPPNIIYGGGTS